MPYQPFGNFRGLLRPVTNPNPIVDVLPKTFGTAAEDHTAAGTSYESLANDIDVDLGTAPLSGNFIVTGFFEQTASATGRNGQLRLRYSIDGGTAWTDGEPGRATNVSTATLTRVPVSAQVRLDAVEPTGNVVIEAQVLVGNTEMTCQNVVITGYLQRDNPL